jgi:hypothetical protein
MFEGVAVDGSSSFVAGESYPIDESGGSDEQQDEEEDQLTPLSVGTKRASSMSTIASSPSKRSKSPVVRSMDNNMREYNEISRYKVRVMQNIWHKRNQVIQAQQMSLSMKIKQVTQLAMEAGTSPKTPKLWLGVLKIIQNESIMDFFLENDSEGRMLIIKDYAGWTTRPSILISCSSKTLCSHVSRQTMS